MISVPTPVSEPQDRRPRAARGTHGLLRNPPLQEAVFEIRWPVASDPRNPVLGDPKHKVLSGRFFDRLSAEFAGPENLPAAALPDSLSVGVVQYRWSSKVTRGVLVQLGPGVLTVNHVLPRVYVWEIFRHECERWVGFLSDVHPDAERFAPTATMFRYINSIVFDASKNDVFQFIREKLHMDVGAPVSVLPADRVEVRAQSVQTQASFMCSDPPGRVTLGFANIYDPEPRLLWQILLDSVGGDVPHVREIEGWLTSAHEVIDTVFWNMISGDLERQFV